MIKQKFSNAMALAGKWKPTSKLGKFAAISLVLIVLAGAGWAGFSWYQDNVWPDFPTAQTAQEDQGTQAKDAAAPLANLVVLKRDYAYRTGDLVKVKLYLKQQPGTTIDIQSLSVNDTFELADKAAIAEQKYTDGSVVYRISLTLQSFKIEKDHTFSGTISWKKGSQRADLALPETHIFTSPTYDGRKNLMEGPDPRVSVYWYGARYVAPMVITFVIYILLLVPAVRVWLRSLVKPVIVDHARIRVEELFAKIPAGNCTKEDHLEIDGLIRARFKLGPIPAGQLEMAIVPPSLIEFLKLNEIAIYSQEDLDDKGKAQLSAKAKTVLARWK